jgi:hypothetical protein
MSQNTLLKDVACVAFIMPASFATVGFVFLVNNSNEEGWITLDF